MYVVSYEHPGDIQEDVSLLECMYLVVIACQVELSCNARSKPYQEHRGDRQYSGLLSRDAYFFVCSL